MVAKQPAAQEGPSGSSGTPPYTTYRPSSDFVPQISSATANHYGEALTHKRKAARPKDAAPISPKRRITAFFGRGASAPMGEASPRRQP